MKLLMITRKVDKNDALAGFTYQWVAAIAASLEKLYVITWQESASDGLPANVELVSLRGGKISKVLEMQSHLFRILPRVSGVFCHMNPEYSILVGPLTRLYRKRLVAWYTHKAKTWRRMLMEIFASRIVTASTESFREPLFSKKVSVIGHGIDTEWFKPLPDRQQGKYFEIITVGRLSPSKQYEIMIEALSLLPANRARLHIIGDVILDLQLTYLDRLKALVHEKMLADRVIFHSWVPHRETAKYYQRADLFINLSTTGSLDKAVLEAMASGCIVVTSNEAFQKMLPSECFLEVNPKSIAQAIERIALLSKEERHRFTKHLRSIVVEHHALSMLGQRIQEQF